MILINLKVENECLQKINRAEISYVLQYVCGIVNEPSKAQSIGLDILLEPIPFPWTLS
jgi:hypothetical protein